MCTKYYLENLKGRDHLEDLDIDGRIDLIGCKGETESGSGQRQVVGCEHRNDPLNSMKSSNFLNR
jgi:hypothetical protein